jgi:thiol-disulfide isomerase/thioredoxin
MNFRSKNTRQFAVSLLQVTFLLLAFFYFGEFSVFYFGALLYLISGYSNLSTKRNFRDFLFFGLSAIVFLTVVFTYFVISQSTNNKIEFPNFLGFTLYSLVFSVSFLLGWLIKVKIKNKTIKIVLFYSILNILLIRASMFFGYPFYASFSGTISLFFSYYIFTKTHINKAIVFGIFIIPFLLIFVLLSQVWEFPIAVLIFIVLSLLTSFFSSRITKNRKKHVALVLSIYLIFTAFNFILMMNWSEYLHSRNDVLTEIHFKENINTPNGELIQNVAFKNKIIVLDLWTTSCSVCFKKFPELENFHNKNKDRNDIEIYALNLPLKRQELSEIKNVIKQLEYDFPFLISENTFSHFRETYNINGVPSVIVLNKKGKIVYNSSFNNNPLIFVNNLQSIVDEISKTKVD